MQRLNMLAREVIEPAMLHALSEDFLAELRNRLAGTVGSASTSASAAPAAAAANLSPIPQKSTLERQRRSRSREIVQAQSLTSPIASVTDEVPPTAADASFLVWVRQLLQRRSLSDVTLKTRNYSRYFSITLGSDDEWFVRYFCGVRRRYLYTLLSCDEVLRLVPSARVFETHNSHGKSRIELGPHDDLTVFGDVVLNSLQAREALK